MFARVSALGRARKVGGVKEPPRMFIFVKIVTFYLERHRQCKAGMICGTCTGAGGQHDAL